MLRRPHVTSSNQGEPTASTYPQAGSVAHSRLHPPGHEKELALFADGMYYDYHRQYTKQQALGLCELTTSNKSVVPSASSPPTCPALWRLRPGRKLKAKTQDNKTNEITPHDPTSWFEAKSELFTLNPEVELWKPQSRLETPVDRSSITLQLPCLYLTPSQEKYLEEFSTVLASMSLFSILSPHPSVELLYPHSTNLTIPRVTSENLAMVTEWWWWLHSSVNLLKTIKLYKLYN